MLDRCSPSALRLTLGLLTAPLAAAAEPVVPLDSLPGWAAEAPGKAVEALLASCLAWSQWMSARPLLPDPAAPGASPAQWRPFCDAAAALDQQHRPPPPPRHGRHDGRGSAARDAAFRAFFATRLVAVPLGAGLLTGYFEPILQGARTPDERHRTPLLAAPRPVQDRASPPAPWPGFLRVSTQGRPRPGAVARYDSATGNPAPPPEDPPPALAGHGVPAAPPPTALALLGPNLPTRGEIAAGALAGRGLELAYVDDPTDAFFLQIQGSGRVQLPDGKVLRLGYAAQNGHPYVSIGRILIAQGHIPREAMSMQAIRRWLAGAPEAEAQAMMAENPSYVFFRELEGLHADLGPPGSLGVPLTPGRSLAVDRSQIPLGAPVFVSGRATDEARFWLLLPTEMLPAQ